MTTSERTFDAPIEDVFATIVEPTTYPHWLVGAKRIRRVSPEWPAQGAWFEHVVGFGPVQLPDRTTSLGAQPPHSFALLVRARPMIEATVRFELEARGEGCVVRMNEEPAGLYKWISAPAGPLLRVRNDRSLARLAAAVEQRGSVADVTDTIADS